MASSDSGANEFIPSAHPTSVLAYKQLVPEIEGLCTRPVSWVYVPETYGERNILNSILLFPRNRPVLVLINNIDVLHVGFFDRYE